ncbi:MAG: hypothetical protein HDS68_06425 [Bacteroidales bacterium]|nr:hypothetical protein [Bacteroidales bacterium]
MMVFFTGHASDNPTIQMPLRMPGKPSVDMGAYSPDTINLIQETPEGMLRIYNRSGKTVQGLGGDDGMEFRVSEQSSTVNIVFGEGNKVWIKNPVSGELRETWVPGTLQEDGKSIVVPMFKFIDYMHSLEFGRQLCVCVWDDNIKMYMPDMSVTEVTYSIEGDCITLEGMSENRILSHAYRAQGETEEEYAYDGTWGESGDFGSVYTPTEVQPCRMPVGFETIEMTFSAPYETFSWSYVKQRALLAFDGDDVYLTGVASLDPDWCVKGTVEEGNLRFPSGQFLGTDHDNSYYFSADPTNGMPGDVVFEREGDEQYYCNARVYITSDSKGSAFYGSYDGVLISSRTMPEVSVMPDDITPRIFKMAYQGYIQSIDFYYDSSANVWVAIKDNEVWISGIFYAPDGAIHGYIEDDKAIFPAGQYLGESSYAYPECWFMPFDPANPAIVLDQLVMDYNEENHTFTNPSGAISISCSDHRNVGIFWYFKPEFSVIEMAAAHPQAPENIEYEKVDWITDPFVKFTIPITDADGYKLLTEYLGYRVYTRSPGSDAVQYVMTPETHEDMHLTEDLAEYPYDLYGDDISWTAGRHSFRLRNLPESTTHIGVQSYYTAGGENNESEIVWLEISTTGIETAESNKPDGVDTQIYDLQGRIVSRTPAPGLYIRDGRKIIIN